MRSKRISRRDFYRFSGARTAGKLAAIEKPGRRRPEYREILFVFREIFGCVLRREDATRIAFALPDGARADRAEAGLPLIAPDSVRVDGGRACAFLTGLLGVMERVGTEGRGELAAMGRALADQALDLPALFAACLARKRNTLTGAAAALSVSPPLLEFVLEIPLKTALENLAAALDPNGFYGWTQGYCPVCGGGPGWTNSPRRREGGISPARDVSSNGPIKG